MIPVVRVTSGKPTPAQRAQAHINDNHAGGGLSAKLNWLRAAVLGANDGIVSVAAVLVGVAGATPERAAILTAGVAALAGGAISMALGEYVSVSSQADSEKATITTHRKELAADPEAEFEELALHYQAKGLSAATARQVAAELTDHDAMGSHLAVEYGLAEDEVVSPGHAALASAVAFLGAAALPFLAILLIPEPWKIALTFVVVLIALAVAGYIGAVIGGGPRLRATARVVLGGALVLAVTFGIGRLLGVSGVV